MEQNRRLIELLDRAVQVGQRFLDENRQLKVQIVQKDKELEKLKEKIDFPWDLEDKVIKKCIINLYD